MTLSIIKIAVAVVLIYAICRVNTHLEKKLNETSGTRTDILFITTIFSVVGLAIFICCQAYMVLKPLMIGLFHI